jgi:DNA-binding CsgD family transcriptional regulator
MPTAPLPLPELERDVLWMASQGFRAVAIAKQHHMSEGGVKNIYWRITHRLGTRNLVHSVAHGLITGIIGPYRDCGERRAYLRHLRRSETPCVACRLANATYVSAQCNAPLPADAGLTPTQTRVLRYLYEHDCSQSEAAQGLSMDRKRVASHMSAVYQRLGVFHMHRYDRMRAAIKIAKDRGYLEES